MVLPAAFPNLLANGAQGIAVGMATSIPPHNVAELCDAALYLIVTPQREREQLTDLRAGSGFPDRRHHCRSRETIAEAYRTGRGAFPPARPLGQGGGQPRHVECRRHRDSLRRAEVAADRKDRRAVQRQKLPLLADIRDELAEDMRIVVEPRASTSTPPS